MRSNLFRRHDTTTLLLWSLLQTHALQQGSPVERRHVMLQGGGGGTVGLIAMHLIFPDWIVSPPAWAAAPITATNSLDLCNSGALLPESSIPGAYEQFCMTLPERSIPLQSSLSSSSPIVFHIQQGASVGAGRTGVAVWNSCLLLTRLLDRLDPVLWFQHKTILELGCGTGLASMVVAARANTRVIATDGNPDVLALAQGNLRNNGMASVETTRLQWGLLEAMDYADEIDLVIGSDLTYNSGTWRVLAETVHTVLQPGGKFLYLTLGHTGFNVNAETDGFLQVAKSLGLVQEDAEYENKLLKACVSAVEKEKVLDATGGAKVIVLSKPTVRRPKSYSSVA